MIYSSVSQPLRANSRHCTIKAAYLFETLLFMIDRLILWLFNFLIRVVIFVIILVLNEERFVKVHHLSLDFVFSDLFFVF